MDRDRPSPTPEEIWRRYDAVESRLTAPVSERMLDLAGLRSGMRVLDLASGRGEPALRAARRVGPSGHVLGVELSDSMLKLAAENAVREGVRNLELRSGNAESIENLPSGYFHAATVRWGLMYMTSPIGALERARRALVPSGVLVAALWAEPERVPYFTLPRRLLAPYRTLPLLDPEVPGTFRYADLARVARDFELAGFGIEHVEEMAIPVIEARTAAELVAWVRAFGLDPFVNELAEDDQHAWEASLTGELERTRSDGWLRLGGVTRLVVARAALE